MRTERTILRGVAYTDFRRHLWVSQRGRCFRCERLTGLMELLQSDRSFHVHHKGGRGMGGSKRDDVLSKVEGLCGACHREQHGQ